MGLSFASKKLLGGNAYENWSLIRFLPLFIGQSVPCEEPAWQILTDLKDIVDLVVCPVHTEDSIAYLGFKISEHRIRFQEVFPDCDLKPKHHFLEHYPYLIRKFGPLVALWTMRFEAKHSFFLKELRGISDASKMCFFPFHRDIGIRLHIICMQVTLPNPHWK